jgi:tRNA dimethylallyltransferase
MPAFDTALILTGPTACGKTGLSLDLAERIGAEVVAMDSMTVYRGMDVGTAKPTPAQRARVPHHLIDVLGPWESATVEWWLRQAEEACREIVGRGARPLFVGGTPFYLKALLHGLFPGPPADPSLRKRLEDEAAGSGNERLHARLAVVDPKTAARLHPNDLRRVVRALEVWELTGKPISACQQTWDTEAFAGAAAPPPARIPVVALELPRELLYDQINRRVGEMVAAGWLEEVRRLQELPHPLSRQARQALGYTELADYLAGRGGGWDETMDRIRTRTRQFAKRQLTWFRHLSVCVPVTVGGDGPETADRVLRAWGEFRAGPENWH